MCRVIAWALADMGRGALALPMEMLKSVFVSAYRYIAITNLPIIPVFVEYLGLFLIDFNQIYSHSGVPKNTSPCIF